MTSKPYKPYHFHIVIFKDHLFNPSSIFLFFYMRSILRGMLGPPLGSQDWQVLWTWNFHQWQILTNEDDLQNFRSATCLVGILQTRMSNWLQEWISRLAWYFLLKLCSFAKLHQNILKKWFQGNIWYFTDRSVKYTPPFPELRNYKSFWLEIFTSDRSWPSETMCKISSRPPARLVFYRPVSILPKMLTFCITTGPISLKFWEQASIINTYRWSKFQVNSFFQSWDIKI